MSERRASCVILGVYGKGNFGDEALLEVVTDDVRQVLPGAEMVVFCSGPQAVSRRFGFHALTRTPATEFRRKLAIVRRSRLLVVGGGTLLCDHGGGLRDVEAVVAYFFWLWVARVFRVPAVLYGQGFGPARGRIVRLGLWLSRFSCTEATVRDSGSHALLVGAAGRRAHFHLAADPVAVADRYLPETVQRRADPDLAARVDALRPYVLFAFRHPKLDSLEDSRDYLEAVGATAARLCRHSGVNVVLFPTHLSAGFLDDRPVVRRLQTMLTARGIPADRITQAAWDSLDDAAYWLQRADLVFGDRLHALLVAALNRVPVAGVAVENKIAGCLADLFAGEPLAMTLAPADVGTAEAEQRLLDLWDKRASAPTVYARLLERYRARRQVNLDAFARALAGRS